jgi:pimeloyl-ACP methyl ester carboxylesterase
MVSGVTNRLIRVGDVDLQVAEAGEGPVVLLIHGFPELAYSWRHQVSALGGAGHRVLAPDLRGYGGSSKPEAIDEYGLIEVVADLVGLLDALEIERAAFVGHDWGSILAYSVAVMHPDRVDRVVSLNVPYRGWCAGFPTMSYIAEHLTDRFDYVLRFQAPGGEEARFEADPERWLRSVYSSIAFAPFLSEDEFAVFSDAYVTGGLAGPLNYYRNIDANWKRTAHLADAPIVAPTLMVTVDSDPVLPAALARGMERWVSDLTVRHIDDCGHWTAQEQPARVSEMLIEFLGRDRG